MDDLFKNQGSFNEDISAWDTSGVTMMARMFYEASSFNQPLSGWQVDKVTNMNQMFGGASAFNQDLGWCVGDDVDFESNGEGATFQDAFSGTQGRGVVRSTAQYSRPRTLRSTCVVPA